MRIAVLVCLLALAARPGDWEQRNRALDELVSAPAETAVPQLVEVLQGDDTFLASRAAQMLRIYGDEARPAVPVLIQALYHEAPSVRKYAYETLHWLGRAAEGASVYLREVHVGSGLRMPPRQRLPQTTPPDVGNTDTEQLAALRDPDPERRAAAAAQLGMRRRRSVQARLEIETALRKSLGDDAWQVRGRAAWTLGGLTADPKVLDEIAALLRDNSMFVRDKAARALVNKRQLHLDPIRKALESDDLRLRRLMGEALSLQACPAPLVAPLTSMCASKDRPERLAALHALQKCGAAAADSIPRLLPLPESDDGEVRNAVYFVLMKVGGRAIEALPVLRKSARRSHLDATHVVTILGGLGTDAHPSLIELLDSDWPRIRANVLYALVRARRRTPEVLAALERGANDPDPTVRRAAGTAMGQLPKTEMVEPEDLLKRIEGTTELRELGRLCSLFLQNPGDVDSPALLDEEAWQLRYLALLSLQREQGRRPELIAKVEGMVRDPNLYLRRLAPHVLRQISRPTEADVPGLLRQLEGDDPEQVRAAIRAFSYAPALAAPALARLTQLVREGDPGTRKAALGLMRHLGGPAIRAGLALLEDSDARLRAEVREMLQRMKREEVVPLVLELRTHESERVRVEAVWILRSSYQQEALVEWLDDSSPAVRKAVVQSLVGNRGRRSLPGLLKALTLKENDHRWSALSALARYGKQAGQVVPAVAPFLFDRDERTRRIAAGTLGAMGRAADPVLDKGLASKDPAVRATSLSGIRHRPDGLEILTRAFADEDVSVRVAACGICRYWTEARPQLIEAIRQEDPKVCNEALQVCAKLKVVPNEAIPAAIAALDSAEARYGARELLGRLFPDSVDAMLAEAEKLRKDSIRRAFASFGDRVVPYLIDALRDEQRERRGVAVWALGGLRRDAREAVPDLKELASRDPELADEIRAALERIEK